VNPHRILFTVAGAMLLLAGISTESHAQGNDLRGVVSGPNGPEAGVWVIAETRDLPTKYAKIVVTDDLGRYLVPDLPRASYDVWVRGYGLVDSPKARITAGTTSLDLTAVPAPSDKEAAQYYPSTYWFALMRVPPENEFPVGKISSQTEWLHTIKQGGCQSCHALGTVGMRTIPELFRKGGEATSVEAWKERVTAGSARATMARDMGALGEAGFKYFAQWTDEIEKGALPFARPERPKGVARNLVVTTWDWSQPTHYLHDLVSSDRRNPKVNANGRVYGSAEMSTDLVPILDPNTHSSSSIVHPVRDPGTPSTKSDPFGPSPYWGPEPIWDSRTLNHNPMLDEKKRVWFTARIASGPNPDFCRSGSSHPSAKAFPLEGEANRHLSVLDPKKGEWSLIRTCFPTHHLNFGFDEDNTLWTSSGAGGANVLGWLNRYVYERTGDEAKAQGWTPFVLDTSGDGKRGKYVEPDEPVDPKKDKRIAVDMYSVAVSPLDGTVWGTVLGYPGGIVRVTPGANPTYTALTEYYEVPLPGFGPRGGDVDTNGTFWVSLASGHLGRFDRSKCKVLKGPNATGRHCPEGWSFHALPGPQLQDVKMAGSAEVSYSTWVDWQGILGLGPNVPIAMGNGSDALYALVKGEFVTLHIPYPMGVFPKNVDGRIDDERAGWKGRGLWTTSATRALFHGESGKEGSQKVVKLQMRPNPLAH
jgi:hypothetical protein